MPALEQLKQKQAEHYREAKRLNELATDPNTDPDLIEELNKQCDDEIKAGDDLNPEIERAEKIAKLMAGEGERKQAELELDGSKKKKVIIPATAKRYLPVTNFQNREIHGMSPEERAYAMGRFSLAVASRHPKFSHLKKYATQHKDGFGEMMAATEGGNAGIWVPEQFGTDLISLMLRYGLARQVLNVLPMTSDKRTDPKEGSDPTPVFVGEGVEGTDVTPTDDSTVTLTARKLMGILIYSSELNEDAITELGDSMLRRLANGFAKKEDDCAFSGDGTSTYGQMIGIKTKLLDVDGAGTDSAGISTGASGTDTAWSGFTLDDFEDAIGLLPDYADDGPEDAPNTVWICHRSFYYQVMVSLERASGGTPATEIIAGFRRPIFYGWPVRFSNAYPSSATTAEIVCTFGNHRLAANFGDRRQYSLDFSDQATVGSVNLWSSDQVGFKAHERFDIAVHSVGTSSAAGPVIGVLSAA